MNVCFLPTDAEVVAAAAVLEPMDEGADVVASTATLVDEMALMTVLWKRAGMEVRSWLFGGRIRRAGCVSCEDVLVILFKYTSAHRLGQRSSRPPMMTATAPLR